MINDQFIIRPLEWESFNFPLQLTNLTTLNDYYRIPRDGKLTVLRDCEYQLIGKLEGKISNKSDLDYHDPNRRLEDGHIIKGETITATGQTEHKLLGCHIETVHFDPLSLQPLLLSIDSSLGLDHVNEIITDRTPSRLRMFAYVSYLLTELVAVCNVLARF